MPSCLSAPKQGRSCVTAPSLVRQLLLTGAFSLLLSNMSHADPFQTVIKQAKVIHQDHFYVLQAELDFPLSPASREALLKGITLSWNIPIRIVQQRRWLWDKEIFATERHYQIRYYALLNIFRVKTEHNQQVSNFASLSTALNSMAQLTVSLLADSELALTDSYQAEFKIIFDRDILPIPLRPLTYFDHEWYLSSEWFTCSLPK